MLIFFKKKFQEKLSSSFKVLQKNRKENFFMEFKPYKDNEYLENLYYKIPLELEDYLQKKQKKRNNPEL